MTNRKYGLTACLALGIFGASTALATDSGVYVGASTGQTSFDIDRNDLANFFVVPANVQIDDSATSYSVAFGYRFMPYVGVELGFNDFGEAAASETGRISTISYNGDLTGSLIGLSAAVIGTAPVGNFEFNVKLGLLQAKTDTRWSLHASGGATIDESGSNSNSSTETLFGLGAGYTIANHFHIRIDWTKSKGQFTLEGFEEGTEEELEVDVERLSLGFQYRF